MNVILEQFTQSNVKQFILFTINMIVIVLAYQILSQL